MDNFFYQYDEALLWYDTAIESQPEYPHMVQQRHHTGKYAIIQRSSTIIF